MIFLPRQVRERLCMGSHPLHVLPSLLISYHLNSVHRFYLWKYLRFVFKL